MGNAHFTISFKSNSLACCRHQQINARRAWRHSLVAWRVSVSTLARNKQAASISTDHLINQTRDLWLNRATHPTSPRPASTYARACGVYLRQMALVVRAAPLSQRLSRSRRVGTLRHNVTSLPPHCWHLWGFGVIFCVFCVVLLWQCLMCTWENNGKQAANVVSG